MHARSTAIAIVLAALALSACGQAPAEDSSRVGALGTQNVGQDCIGLFGIGDHCSGDHPYPSTDENGRCLCRDTPCSVSGWLFDQNDNAQPSLTIRVTTDHGSGDVQSDGDGHFFAFVECAIAASVSVLGVDEMDTLVDPRANPADVLITVEVGSADPHKAADGDCYEAYKNKSVANGDCYVDPLDAKHGYRCVDQVPQTDDACTPVTCEFARTYLEGECYSDYEGSACTCEHDGTWRCDPLSRCPSG